MFYDPRTEKHGLKHSPVLQLVTPRPIGWITTISPEGVVNLAPYSFFNLVSGNPPWMIFSSAPRKHSQTNAETTGEFTFSLATWDLREVMNQSSADFPSGMSEPAAVGIEMAPSQKVKPPRVFYRTGTRRNRLHGRPDARAAELAAPSQYRASSGSRRHRRVDGAGIRGHAEALIDQSCQRLLGEVEKGGTVGESCLSGNRGAAKKIG